MTGSGARQGALHILLQIVLLALADYAVEHDEEDTEAERKQPGADELIPPR